MEKSSGYILLIGLASFAVGAGFAWSSADLGAMRRKRPVRFWTIATSFSCCVGLAVFVAQKI